MSKPIEGQCGEHVSTFSKRLVEMRQKKLFLPNGKDAVHDFKATFNGAIVTVTITSTATSIEADFMGEIRKAGEAYRNSPEYKAQKVRESSEADRKVAKFHKLMKKLSSIKFSNSTAVLDWLSEYYDVIDFVPALDKDPAIAKSLVEVAKVLESKGYEPNANTAEKFNGENEDNFARYLIGQVLACIRKGQAVPQIFSSMYDDFDMKFNPVRRGESLGNEVGIIGKNS